MDLATLAGLARDDARKRRLEHVTLFLAHAEEVCTQRSLLREESTRVRSDWNSLNESLREWIGGIGRSYAEQSGHLAERIQSVLDELEGFIPGEDEVVDVEELVELDEIEYYAHGLEKGQFDARDVDECFERLFELLDEAAGTIEPVELAELSGVSA